MGAPAIPHVPGDVTVGRMRAVGTLHLQPEREPCWPFPMQHRTDTKGLRPDRRPWDPEVRVRPCAREHPDTVTLPYRPPCGHHCPLRPPSASSCHCPLTCAPTPLPLQEVPTLRQLWARGQQVILSYDDESAINRHRELWPAIPYWWGDQVKPEKLVRYLERMESCGRPGGCGSCTGRGSHMAAGPHARFEHEARNVQAVYGSACAHACINVYACTHPHVPTCVRAHRHV